MYLLCFELRNGARQARKENRETSNQNEENYEKILKYATETYLIDSLVIKEQRIKSEMRFTHTFILFNRSPSITKEYMNE